MFESYEFLDYYLPEYFEKVVSRAHSSSKVQRPIQYDLKTLSQLIKYSHNLYKALSLEDHFSWFLSQQFPFLQEHKQENFSSPTENKYPRKNKVMEVLESKLDKISLACVELYIKILQIQIIISEKRLTNEEIIKFANIFLVKCNQARLQYELNKIQMQFERNFDEYMVELFRFVLKEGISSDMQIILKEILSNQFSNFSNQAINQIQSFFKKIPAQSTKAGQQSCTENDVAKIIRKTAIKRKKPIQGTKMSPTKKRTDKLNKQNQIQASPDKLPGQKQRQPLSPASKTPFEKFRKQKLINKKRTIYYQRKNLYMPKVRDFLQKMNSLSSLATMDSIDKQKKTQTKLFKLQNTQSAFEDNDSILVRSTPKQTKKFHVKMICQKLDF